MRALLVAALLAFGLAACTERPQEPFTAQGEKRYQGKADTPAWGSGDRAAWEDRIKHRQLTQHEDRRIYQP
jgi:hypothetical protein